LLRATVFGAVVIGIFWAFAAIMGGPAGGQKAIAGDWRVQSASVNGRPTSDAAVGSDWLWVSFDPYGRFSARTKRFTIKGKYDVNPVTKAFSVRYDPEPLPPIYPGQSLDAQKLTPAEELRYIGEQQPGFKWPVELTGSFRRVGQTLIVTAEGRFGQVEWVLVPYHRPKF
jgi:hypothetical protein